MAWPTVATLESCSPGCDDDLRSSGPRQADAVRPAPRATEKIQRSPVRIPKGGRVVAGAPSQYQLGHSGLCPLRVRRMGVVRPYAQLRRRRQGPARARPQRPGCGLRLPGDLGVQHSPLAGTKPRGLRPPTFLAHRAHPSGIVGHRRHRLHGARPHPVRRQRQPLAHALPGRLGLGRAAAAGLPAPPGGCRYFFHRGRCPSNACTTPAPRYCAA